MIGIVPSRLSSWCLEVFGLLPETVGYLALYLATLILHVVFLGYVLAGSAYLAVVVTLRKPGERGPLEPLLREWLPFMLSLAITAGVAPLLFLQILYRPAFYTANLLLFNRWMAVVPVLIVGFYLLYLLKNRWRESNSRGLSIAIATVTAACFLFIAWSWTENHLLSIAGQETWSRQYVSHSVVYHSAELLPRLGMWFSGTLPILAIWLSWQLWWTADVSATTNVAGSRQAAAMGLAGMLAAAVCGALYAMAMPGHHRGALLEPGRNIPWVLTIGGAAAAALLLINQFRCQRLTVMGLSLMSGSMLVMLAGVACLREAIRLASVDVMQFHDTHVLAAAVGGRWVFVAFLAVNAVLIGWCLRMVVRRDNRGV